MLYCHGLLRCASSRSESRLIDDSKMPCVVLRFPRTDQNGLSKVFLER